ncbi:glycosyltransferase family 2 protein [Pontibacter sp. E15-1]|uniref:glycosyltransferase family 2 protein n=1 Tax=Pontibacter sp. E15-1 TaxID=2919918 RepID=UPI001F4F1949|nr:glycosyltransferase family A protein [Pontibacter sp. E15-1]MCJ8166333.1 glycosyltransferase family 2 protein [Pontibacter sp. E15-1]
MYNPLVSIIIPLYNREQYILATIKSIIDQTYCNWEVVVIDDHSEDNSYNIVESLSSVDNRIKLYKRPSGLRKGACACRNHGLKLAKGEFIVFLDSDDLLAHYCLQKRVKNILLYPDYDYWIYPMMLFNKEIGDLDIISNINSEEDDLDRFLSRDQVWLITGPIWRKETLLNLGGFIETLPSQQDYDLHIRALIYDYKYIYFDLQCDSYYRQITSSHPGKKAFTLLQLFHRINLIFNIYNLLILSQKVNKKRKRLISHQILHLVQRIRWNKTINNRASFSNTLNFWGKAFKLNIIDFVQLMSGSLFILISYFYLDVRFRRLYTLIVRILKLVSNDLFLEPKNTLCKIHYSSVIDTLKKDAK